MRFSGQLCQEKPNQSELLGTFFSVFPVCRNPAHSGPARAIIALSFEGSLALHRSCVCSEPLRSNSFFLLRTCSSHADGEEHDQGHHSKWKPRLPWTIQAVKAPNVTCLFFKIMHCSWMFSLSQTCHAWRRILSTVHAFKPWRPWLSNSFLPCHKAPGFAGSIECPNSLWTPIQQNPCGPQCWAKAGCGDSAMRHQQALPVIWLQGYFKKPWSLLSWTALYKKQQACKLFFYNINDTKQYFPYDLNRDCFFFHQV